jgi:hypothetical protein
MFRVFIYKTVTPQQQQQPDDRGSSRSVDYRRLQSSSLAVYIYRTFRSLGWSGGLIDERGCGKQVNSFLSAFR